VEKPKPPPPNAVYGFFEWYLGTDKQWAALFVLLAALLFLGCEIVYFATAEYGSADFASAAAFTGASLLLLIAACLYVFLSYPGPYERIMTAVKEEDRPNLFFMAAALLALGFVAFFVYPCYEINQGAMDPMVAVVYLSLVIVGFLLLVFFVFASATTQLKQNDGRGSGYLFSLLCTVVGTCFTKDSCGGGWYELLESFLGSDFVIGFYVLYVISLAIIAGALVSLVPDYTNMIRWVFLGAAMLFALGTFGMCYTSFKETKKSAFMWGLLTHMCCCAVPAVKDDDMEAAGGAAAPAATGEKEPLLKK